MRDLSLHLMDIIQNSVSAGASEITIRISAESCPGELLMSVADNGAGMDEELAGRVTDPFATTRTTRKVGLGIPLLEASAGRASGRLTVSSVKDRGTLLEAVFKIAHIDRLPLGSLGETMMSVISANPEIDFQLDLESRRGNFRFDTREVRGQLGEVPINTYEVLAWIMEYITEGVRNIFGGVLDEIDS